MGKRKSPAQIEKEEFTCDKCKKQFDEICSFTQYGNEARKNEYLKGSKYCEECFKIVEDQIS